MPLEFPRRYVVQVQELGARLLESRKPKTPTDSLARDLLAGFHDICVRSGLDRVLVDLGVEIDDASSLYEHETLRPALAKQIDAVDIDGGGPRNAKPRQLADSVVAALGLNLTEEDGRTITLDESVRGEITAAVAAVVNAELPKLRDTVIGEGRAACEERYLSAFEKIVAQLDERGLRMMKEPKVPLDASQAVQRLLADTRNVVLGRIASAALDRASAILGRVSPEAVQRIDAPVTHRMTPREVTMRRVCDSRLVKLPAVVVEAIVGALTELAALAWKAAERQARPYKATESFAVGELIEHPKFGRGSVVTVAAQRIEVEFADGKHTLVHVRRA